MRSSSRWKAGTVTGDMIIADQKYQFICDVCRQCVTHLRRPGELTAFRSDRRGGDQQISGASLFAGIMILVFFITFGPLGTWMTNLAWTD